MKTRIHDWSDDIRWLVIKHFRNGHSERDIAFMTDVSRNTVHSIISKFKKTGDVKNCPGKRRKRITTSREDRLIHRKILSNRKMSAQTVAGEIYHETGQQLSAL